ncbi:MAG TPA: CdaR family protein [Candidatus Dormibacteraeota bacterium]|nr:CdaR family protein [Candidatus Dormibacteraeota bacterium]
MFGNLRLKLIAIFFAVALWSVVAYTSNPTQSQRLKLPVSNPTLPAGLVLVGDAPQVTVNVIGTADNLKTFVPTDLRVSGNFSNVRVGNNHVPIRVDNTDPAVQVDAPTTIGVTVDQLASANLNVSVQRLHSLTPGYHELANATTVTPSAVRVDGPKGKLTGLEAVVQVDLNTINAPGINLPTPVLLFDANKKPVTTKMTITPPLVTVKMVIEADAITVTKSVGFTLTGQPASGYRVTNVQVTPLQVQATGLQNALGTISVLNTDAIDISNQKSDVIKTVTIRPPNGVDVSPKVASVHVFISAIPGVSPSASP